MLVTGRLPLDVVTSGACDVSCIRTGPLVAGDQVLPPSAAEGMEKIIPDLEKYLVRGSGHWTQQEKPDEVSNKLIEWRKKRFG